MIKSFVSSLILTIFVLIAPMSMAENLTDVQQTEVNINQADADELDKHLDGVGKVKAQAIVDYRDKHGQFDSVEELSDVKGIGSSIVDRNRERIRL